MPDALAHLPAFAWTTDRAGNLTSQTGSKELRGSLGPWTMEAHARALEGRSTAQRLAWRGSTLEVRVEPLVRGGVIEGSAGVALEATGEDGDEADRLEALGRLAHEFNNLLLVIGGNASLLARELDTGSDDRRRADAILDATRRAAGLTELLQALVIPG